MLDLHQPPGRGVISHYCTFPIGWQGSFIEFEFGMCWGLHERKGLDENELPVWIHEDVPRFSH
jgi:hypothetical protein